MKKIIFFLAFFLVSFVGFSQAPIGCPSCTTEIKGILKVDSLFLLPLRNDTLVNPGRPGAIVVAYGKTWLYTGTQWSVLVGAAWGSIPGNITTQTDLMTLLNGKQDSIGNGYGWKKIAGKGVFDSAIVRKVDTIGKVNDSTIFFKINGQTFNLVIKGSASGSIVSTITLSTPSSIFISPVTYTNVGGNWTATLALQNQNPNTVWSGPPIGSPGQPGFRSLAVADLPTGIPPSYILASTVNFWNAKVDSTILSNDSVYEFRNGIKYFRYMVSGGVAGSDSGIVAGLWIGVDRNTATFRRVKADSAAMAAYFLRRKDSVVNYVTPSRLADSAVSLRGLITSGFDSATSQGVAASGGFHSRDFNDARYLRRVDSTGVSGFVTHAQEDTAKINLRNQIAAAAAPQTISSTQGPTNYQVGLSGSNTDVINIATTNLAGLLDTTRTRWIDSARSGKLTDTTVYRETGVVGNHPFYLTSAGRTTTISIPKLRDTSAPAITITPDSALAIPTHDTTSAIALLPLHRLADSTAVLRSLLVNGFDSTNTQGVAWRSFGFNDARYKRIADTTGATSYVPRNQVDTMRDNTRAAIFTKKDKADSTGPTSYVPRNQVDTMRDRIASKQNLLVNGNGTTINSNKVDLGGLFSADFNINDTTLAHLRTAQITGNFQIGNTIARVGTILNDTFQRGSLGSSYVKTGSSGTLTMSGTSLDYSYASYPGLQADYVTFVATTGRNRWKMYLDVIPTTIGSALFGITLDCMSYSGFYNAGISTQYNFSTSGGLNGQVLMRDMANATLATSATNTALIALDTLSATLERIDNFFIATLFNKRTSVTTTLYYTFPTNTVNLLPRTGQWRIGFLGGSGKITRFKITSDEVLGAPTFIGNSNMAGFLASNISNRYTNLMYQSREQYNQSGGPGDRSLDILPKLTELLTNQSKYWFVSIGTNDLENSVSLTTTFPQNIDSICRFATHNGVKLVFGACPPDGNSGKNIKPYNDTVAAVAGRYGFKFVDTWTPLQSGGSWIANYKGDNLHMSDSGHIVYANTLRAAAPELLNAYRIRNAYLPGFPGHSARLLSADSLGDFYIADKLDSLYRIGRPLWVGENLPLTNGATPSGSFSNNNSGGGSILIINRNTGGWSALNFHNAANGLRAFIGHANSATSTSNGVVADSTFIFKGFNADTYRFAFQAGNHASTSTFADLIIFRGSIMMGSHTASGRTVNPQQGMIYWDTDSLDYVNYTTANGWKKWWRNAGLTSGGASTPFPDNSAFLKNNTDNTKLLKFDLSGLTTGTTRTWIFPDVNGTVARNDAGQTFAGVQAFASSPTVPNLSANDNSTKVPNTSYVDAGDAAVLAAIPQPLKFIQTADATVTNTTSGTSIVGTGGGSQTVTAGNLTLGRLIKVKGHALLSTDPSSAPTLLLAFFNSSSNAANSVNAAVTTAMNNAQIEWDFDCTIRSIGASGSIQIDGNWWVNGQRFPMSTPLFFNTTVSQTFDIRATFGTASTDNTIVGKQMSIILY